MDNQSSSALTLYRRRIGSLPDEEYEIFTLTLINGKQILNYTDVSAALVNFKVRRQDKMSSFGSISVEALVIRDRSSNQKGKDNRGRSSLG